MSSYGQGNPTKYNPQRELTIFGLTLIVALTASLKLSVAYIALVPLLIIWLSNNNSFKKTFNANLTFQVLQVFIFSAAISSLFGFDPLRSITKLTSLTLVSLLILVGQDVSSKYSPYPIISALVAGQVIASSWTIISSGFIGNYLNRELFIGVVTQSGQLAAITSLLVVLLFNYNTPKNFIKLTVLSILFTLTSYYHYLWGLIFPLTGVVLGRNKLFLLSLATLMSALLINLKRGPWLGLSIVLMLLCFRSGRRQLIILMVLASLLLTLSAPIRNRLLQSQHDFFIAGGRSIMWQIGAKLTAEYPLGIGFGNSKELRRFSNEVPPEHRHFHNNLLNITVETGWISSLIFMAWIAVSIRFLIIKEPIKLAASSAILANQIAGLVEYNFGDTEILIVIFLILGIAEGTKLGNKI